MQQPFPYASDRRLSREQERQFRLGLRAAAEQMSSDQLLGMAEVLQEALRDRGDLVVGRRRDLRL